MLYLVRHGAAAPAGSDDERPLTSQGRSQVRELVQCLIRSKAAPSAIWHSEKKRAVETAELIASGLGLPGSRSVVAGLTPDACPDTALSLIETFFIEQPSQSLMIVSHLPFLPLLASHLMPGCCSSGMVMPTAGCWFLDHAGSGWSLEDWFVPGV